MLVLVLLVVTPAPPVGLTPLLLLLPPFVKLEQKGEGSWKEVTVVLSRPKGSARPVRKLPHWASNPARSGGRVCSWGAYVNMLLAVTRCVSARSP